MVSSWWWAPLRKISFFLEIRTLLAGVSSSSKKISRTRARTIWFFFAWFYLRLWVGVAVHQSRYLTSWMTESSVIKCKFRQGLEPPSCDSFHKGTGPSCKYNFFHACRNVLYSLLMVKKNALLILVSKGAAQALRPPLKFWLVQFWSDASQMVTAASWIFSSLTSWLIMRLDELKEVLTNEDERTELHNEIVQAIDKSLK